MKIESWREAIESATIVLDLAKSLEKHADLGISPSDQCKALFRRGQALGKVSDFEPALADLQAAQKLAPEDKLIQREIALVQRTMKEKAEKERKAYAKLFA